MTSALAALQWGRALSCAEIDGGEESPSECRTASMGPRTLVRGNKYELLIVLNTIKLQWGRALSCAEIGAHRGRGSGSVRFNGAAHSRARKWRSLERLNFQ